MSNPSIGYLYLNKDSKDNVGVEVTITGLNKQQASDFTEEVLTLAKTKYGATFDKISSFGIGPVQTVREDPK